MRNHRWRQALSSLMTCVGLPSSLPPQMTPSLADPPLPVGAVQGKPGILLQALNATAEVRCLESGHPSEYSDLPGVDTLIISYLCSQG